MKYLSISLHTIKRGQIFWECDGGRDACFIAIADAKREGHGYGLNAIDILTGKPQHFYEAERGGAYGPRLYDHPEYTRPDYAALLTGLARVALALADEAEKQATARESGLKLVATQCSESCDEWQSKSKAAEREIARLRRIIDEADAAAREPGNGITVSRRVLTALQEADNA